MLLNYKNINPVLAIVLVLLLSLSCPIKNDIKELLGVPAPVEANINKSYTNSCTYVLAKENKSGYNKEIKKRTSPLLVFDNASNSHSLKNVNVKENVLTKPQHIVLDCSVPIFIHFRKIII